MSETRYTPDQLEERSTSLAWIGHDDNRIAASQAFYLSTHAMLRQAAADARVIEQLRAWLNKADQDGCP